MKATLFFCTLILCSNLSAMQDDVENIVKELASMSLLDLLKRHAHYHLSEEEQKIWEQYVFNRKHKPPLDEVEKVQERVVTNIIDDPFTRSIIHPYYLSAYRPQFHASLLNKVIRVTPHALRRVIGK